MNPYAKRWLCHAPACAAALVVAACAVPATEVAVTTMPMRHALDLAQADATPAPTTRHDLAPLEKRTLPPAIEGAILSTPDVRLAYLYEWIDADGNRHYGEWVAIPVASSHWVLSDGTRAPIELNTPNATLPPESP